MGTEHDDNMILFMNGEAIGPIKDFQMTTVEPNAEPGTVVFDLSKSNDFTATFTPRFPHITRKHFIRNLRKFGQSKKLAKQIAWNVKRKKLSYSYARFLYMIGALPNLIR